MKGLCDNHDYHVPTWQYRLIGFLTEKVGLIKNTGLWYFINVHLCICTNNIS